MKTIKVYECECGEDIYEDDRSELTPPDQVECINCYKQYPKSVLKDEPLMEVIEQTDVKAEDAGSIPREKKEG